MIIAFSPDQLHEVSRAFDAPWFMSDSLHPSCNHKEGTCGTQDNGTASNDDTKPPAKESLHKAKKGNSLKAKSRSNNNNDKKKSIFQACHNYQHAARCARQALNKRNLSNVKTIEQRTPIHYDQETPQVAKMSLDVTGFAPEDIAVSVEDFVVSIKGERTNKLGDVFVLDRRFRLDKSTVCVDDVIASIDDGILELTVPKKSTIGPRKIPISISSSATNNNSLPKTNEEVTNSHKEDEVFTDSESIDESSHEEQSDNTEENVENSIEVETVKEEESSNDERVEKKNQSAGIEEVEETTQNIGVNTDSVADNSADDQAWEEVSN
mmetsp:Transcript_4605/g.11838  ORF Transcript_4605/g.11838 Transcript_4605/m.11838 type:complete len:323 (-) Transcript_4605:227-1195(-)|eukprot:CAMPEP_0197177712 /NCGR_PEP_ID=MMETSP1423-20130617/3224_1 /TAXON_ID=476441 /ORGANISM="Pseudo-nitzschia heimii, Strain UNC1101" /LENGTH=322 /DNA_ID=CAMNT_0042627309 /DNA_START=109 /DNA_END=1077 /DNA_ORIENTATION=-